MTLPSPAPAPERGVFEADAAPGCIAFVVLVDGVRRARVELLGEDREDAIAFLFRLLTKHDRHLRLVD